MKGENGYASRDCQDDEIFIQGISPLEYRDMKEHDRK